MSINDIHLAINSTDLNQLMHLTNSRDVNVRRAVAKNNHINSDIANILALDPVLNVSYVACQHKSCTVQREFDPRIVSHQCIQCTRSEHELDCMACDNHKY